MVKVGPFNIASDHKQKLPVTPTRKEDGVTIGFLNELEISEIVNAIDETGPLSPFSDEISSMSITSQEKKDVINIQVVQ